MASRGDDVDLFERRGSGEAGRAQWRQLLSVNQAVRANLVRDLSGDYGREALVGLLHYDLDNTRIAIALGQESDAQKALQSAARVGGAALTALSSSQGEITIEIDPGKSVGVRLFPTPPKNGVIPPLLLDIIAAACLARNDETRALAVAADVVDRVADAAVRGNHPVGQDRLWRPYCAAWRGLLLESPVDEILEQIRLTRQFAMEANVGRQWNSVTSPALDVMGYLARGNGPAFQELMKSAWASFGAFWDEPDNALFAGGLFPLDLAALCVIAIDRKMPGVRDLGLLPAWLVG